MPVRMNTKATMHPDELAMSVATMSTEAKTWLESSIMVEKVKTLKDLCLSNCRLLYGSDRFKFYDIAICEDEEQKKFAAILTCSQDGMIKLLRTEVSDDPVEAVQALVDRLQKDTAILFTKYTAGSQIRGQQGYTNPETRKFELNQNAREYRIAGPQDDIAGLTSAWSDAPGGHRHPPGQPRGNHNGHGGYEGRDRKRSKPMDHMERPSEPAVTSDGEIAKILEGNY